MKVGTTSSISLHATTY